MWKPSWLPAVGTAAYRAEAKNEVHIDVESEGTDIYYTTDGTEPTAQSAKYEVPFILDKKGTVKAITYDAQSRQPIL